MPVDPHLLALADELLQAGAATTHEASSSSAPLDPTIRSVWGGAQVAGIAFTVRVPEGDNLGIHRSLVQADPGSVLVVDAAGGAFGYWGEILTAAAMARGIRGLVIDGSVRDVTAVESQGFPVFCRGVSVRGTQKRERGVLNEPIEIAGTAVAPGDLIVADSDGVVVLPAAIAEDAAAAARGREEREEELLSRIRAGESTIDLYDF